MLTVLGVSSNLLNQAGVRGAAGKVGMKKRPLSKEALLAYQEQPHRSGVHYQSGSC